MITLQVNIENEIYANLFAELVSKFTFVDSVVIPASDKKLHDLQVSSEELLVLSPKQQADPARFYGIWKDRDIENRSQFREQDSIENIKSNSEESRHRKFGQFKGKIILADDFNDDSN